MLIGLKPTDTVRLKFRKKGKIRYYTLGDCKYDLDSGYLALAPKESKVTKACMHVCSMLTCKEGTLVGDAVTLCLYAIETSMIGRPLTGE